MFENSTLHGYKIIRATAPNMLALRVKAIRQDLTRGRDFEEATDSIIVRAAAVVTQKGVVSSGVFLKENKNG
jgi:hypothetical protein